MTEEMVFKRGFLLGLIKLLQIVAPAITAVACLYIVTYSYGVNFDSNYVGLAVLVGVLTLAVLQRPNYAGTDVFGERGSLIVGTVLNWALVLTALLIIGYATKLSSIYSRRALFTWSLVTPLVIVLVVLALHLIVQQVLSDPTNKRLVVIAGLNEASQALADKLRLNSSLGMSVAGFFDDRSAERLGVEGHRLLGRLPDLAAYVKRHRVDVIFVALPIRHVQRVMDLLDELRDTTASIYFVPDVFVFDLIQARTFDIYGIPVVAMCETPLSGYRGFIKRSMDMILTLASMPILLPVMLAIAIGVKISSPGPVIFRQRRYGLDGQQITVYKFRTMTQTDDGAVVMQATRDDQRVTPFGRFLRKLSLDELPQLLNVLQGRMSLVGPRPHAVAHNEQYRGLIKGYMLRHKVLPGLTGLAQVSGCRGETADLAQMEARVKYDLDYLRHWSPLLDLKILILTVVRLFGDERAY